MSTAATPSAIPARELSPGWSLALVIAGVARIAIALATRQSVAAKTA